jgi:hypothetical protein
MNSAITRPITTVLVMVYGNDLANKALMAAGRIVRMFFT